MFERMRLGGGKALFHGDARTKCAKSRLVSERFCSTLNDYDRAQNTINISETECCALHELKVYATH